MAVLVSVMSRGRGIAGSEIAEETSLASGTLYPILRRLESGGLLSSRWEETAPQVLNRPRRRLYEITGLGERLAREKARSLSGMLGKIAEQGG
jgi:DNA-binding PadR family transcriptional regulator